MLAYFRYFSVISFIVISVAGFFAGGQFRSFVLDRVIRAPIEQTDRRASEYLAQKVWCRYAENFAPLKNQGANFWRQEPNFKKWEAHALLILSTLGSNKVSIYLPSGEILLSSSAQDPIFFSKEGNDHSGASIAAQGKNYSRIIPSMGVYGAEGELEKGTFIHNIIPLWERCNDASAKPTAPALLLETYRNIGVSADHLYQFQIIVTGGIIGIFMMLYMALFITSRKTEKIIEKQHEENLALAQAKARAELQSSEKSMFLANVTHELRTPLNAVIGFSEILKDESLGPLGNPQYKEYVSDIHSSGVHLLSLINDILDYSKAEAQKLEVEMVELDLTKIGEACIRLVEPRARSSKVQLVPEIPEKHILLTADPKRMKQTILNLLSNSVKFTPENGKVMLAIREDLVDGKIQVEVRDTGIGIAAKDISRALAPFGQIDSSLSRRYEGTGLGLPLTKKLTEIMGGTFSIQSEVGLGTTVTLTFPLRREHKNPKAEMEQSKQF